MHVDWDKEPAWAEHKGIDVALGLAVTWGYGRYQYDGGDVCIEYRLPSFYRTHSRPDPLED
jgi:hypothetical protein